MKTKIAIVGAGIGGKSVLESFFYETDIEIIAVIDTNPNAAGIIAAKSMGVKTFDSIELFFRECKKTPELILNLTGKDELAGILNKTQNIDSKIVTGSMAKFFWNLINEKNMKILLEEKYHLLKKEIRENLSGSDFIVGNNYKMQEIQTLLKKIAPTPSTVLLTGETGTGKEIIADSIYQNSLLVNKEFLKINCTAISPELLESELFGHKKGAFTGALNNKQGLLERADGGTVFLDEIGDISSQMQVKLLRFLQFGEIKPVGCTQTKKVNVRIIAATNRNLEEMIQEGSFRSDLYYRINTIVINIPPLRERKEDISIFAYHFLKKNVRKINKTVTSISSEALDYLYEYNWPGNLRELDSVIERAVILTNTGQIDIEHLTHVIQDKEKQYDLTNGFMNAKQVAITLFEKKAINYYLNFARGNVSKAALTANIPRKTFYRLLKKHNIDPSFYKT